MSQLPLDRNAPGPGRGAAADGIHWFRSSMNARAAIIAPTGDDGWDRVPVRKRETLGGAALEQGSADINVDAPHQGFLRLTSALGGQILIDAAVTSIEQARGLWPVRTAAGTSHTPPGFVYHPSGGLASHRPRLTSNVRHPQLHPHLFP